MKKPVAACSRRTRRNPALPVIEGDEMSDQVAFIVYLPAKPERFA